MFWGQLKDRVTLLISSTTVMASSLLEQLKIIVADGISKEI